MSSNEPELIRKARKLKDCLEKLLSIFSGGLFVISCSIDLLKLTCFWSDYVIMFYSCIFLVLMIWHSIIPNKLPFYIKENLVIVCFCNGKGYLMVIISILFIKDNLYFLKFASILLLLSGLVLIIFEILVPTIEKKNNNNDIKNISNQKDVKIEEKEKQDISIEDKIKKANNPYNIPDDF